jgi:hypothetical protein
LPPWPESPALSPSGGPRTNNPPFLQISPLQISFLQISSLQIWSDRMHPTGFLRIV